MKTDNDFIKYYEEEYKNIINNDLTNELAKYRQSLIMIIIGMMTPLVLIYLNYLNILKVNSSTQIFIYIILVFSFFLLLISGIKTINNKKKKMMHTINNLIFADIIKFITDNNYEYTSNMELAEEDFAKINLFNLETLYYQGRNFTRCVNNSLPMIISDVSLYTLKDETQRKVIYDEKTARNYIYDVIKKVPNNIFDGIYLETFYQKKNDIFIYLIDRSLKNKINYNKYLTFNGEELLLENIEVSKDFYVYATNETQARYVLSLPLMEKINYLNKLSDRKKYIVFKPDGRVGIFIDGVSIENLFNQNLVYYNNRVSKKYLIEYFRKVRDLLLVYRIFTTKDNEKL